MPSGQWDHRDNFSLIFHFPLEMSVQELAHTNPNDSHFHKMTKLSIVQESKTSECSSQDEIES